MGEYGQKIFSDWIDTVSRNGGVEGGNRAPFWNHLRRNFGMAQLAYRMTTIGLQPFALFQALPVLREVNVGKSIPSILSAEKRAWVLKNFPEVRARIGDDPAYSDFGPGRLKKRAGEIGFKPITVLDRFAAMTVAEAAYRDFVESKG